MSSGNKLAVLLKGRKNTPPIDPCKDNNVCTDINGKGNNDADNGEKTPTVMDTHPFNLGRNDNASAGTDTPTSRPTQSRSVNGNACNVSDGTRSPLHPRSERDESESGKKAAGKFNFTRQANNNHDQTTDNLYLKQGPTHRSDPRST